MTTYGKTEAGQRAFKERSTAMSARQRTAFLMLDGQRSVQQVIEATGAMGITPEDFQHLLASGFVREIAGGEGGAASAAPGAAAPPPADAPAAPATVAVAAAPVPPPAAPVDTAELYLKAYPIATRLTGSLGLRGFRLNLAVESARGYEELVALLPRIRDAVGAERCQALEQALRS